MYLLPVGAPSVYWIKSPLPITLPVTYPASTACFSVSLSLVPVPFTGQIGVTPPASKPLAWMGLDAASSPIPISSGPMASPLTMPGIVCTGWMLSTTSSRGPIWMGVTARLSLAKVRSFLPLLRLSSSFSHPSCLGPWQRVRLVQGPGRPCLD